MSSNTFSSVEEIRDWVTNLEGTLSAFALLVPVVTIAVSEALLFLGDPATALRGHVATILYAVIAPVWISEETDTLGALALVSVLRSVTLGMPVFFEFTLYWLPFVYAPFLPGLYVLRRVSGFVDVPLGVKTGATLLPAAVPIGYALAELEYRVLAPGTLLPSQSAFHVGVFLIVMIALVALVEEYLFRGLLQGSMTARFGEVPGIVLASLVFGLTRAVYGVGPGIALSFGIGMGLGVLYSRTESLTAVTLIHGSLNVFLFGLLPLRGSLLF